MKNPSDVVHQEPTASDLMLVRFKGQIGLLDLATRESLAQYARAVDLGAIP